MKCPHCRVEFHGSTKQFGNTTDRDGVWSVNETLCPSCGKVTLTLIHFNRLSNGTTGVKVSEALIRPKVSNRPPVPIEVPDEFSKDYLQACLVLSDSPMASAALSRRCLQHLIREQLKIKEKDLAKEIQKVIDTCNLPSDLSESIDFIRNIGNFAAHPIKSTSTGEIVEVEPNEAEWNLEVLEMLYDYLFVQPEVRKKRREALNLKLADAGKPAIKQ